MTKVKDNTPKEKGVYVFFLKCEKESVVKVGKLGNIALRKGIYAYVGSAYGGGGLKSRLSRHVKTAKKCRWHIDYIRRHMKAVEIWYTYEDKEVEHTIAQRLYEMCSCVPMIGFGSSDCGCEAHLFHFNSVPPVFMPYSIKLV